MTEYIDVIVPRGGKKLVKKVQKLSKIPTIGMPNFIASFKCFFAFSNLPIFL